MMVKRDKEPQIYDAIKFGAILENIGFQNESSTPDYTDGTITENTRVSYPIDHIENIVLPSKGKFSKEYLLFNL